MKTYKVFTHPSGSTQAVKQGWSWPAFLVPHIWALFKRLWGLAAGASFAFVALVFISEDVDIDQIGPFLVLVGAELGVRIIFGANGSLGGSRRVTSLLWAPRKVPCSNV
jgi:hypothetical protein